MLNETSSGWIWLMAWFAINIGVTLMNKSFFVWDAFKFPITLSMIHMIFSCIGSTLVLKTGNYATQQLTLREQVPVILFSVLFCANIVVGNLALKFVAVSLVQVVRSIIPGVTMALSMLLLGRTYERAYYWVVALIVFGVALASAGEVEFHVFGFVATVLVCFLSSTKSVMAQKFLVGKLKFHPFELLQRMSLLAALQMALLAYFIEYDYIRDWWRIKSEFAADVGDNSAQTSFLVRLALNGVLAFFLNYTNFMTTKKTSALTVTVAGNVKHMCTILFSVLMFRNPISIMNACGTIVTLIGAVLYSSLEYQAKQARASSSTK